METPFVLPQALLPLFVGGVVLLLGVWLVSLKNIIVRLIGLIIALGGVSSMLTALPNSWVSPGIKFIVVIIVYIVLSADLARTGWKTSKAATLIGSILGVLGILALIVQIDSFFSVPTGALQQAIQDGFETLSRIFGLAEETLR